MRKRYKYPFFQTQGAFHLELTKCSEDKEIRDYFITSVM